MKRSVLFEKYGAIDYIKGDMPDWSSKTLMMEVIKANVRETPRVQEVFDAWDGMRALEGNRILAQVFPDWSMETYLLLWLMYSRRVLKHECVTQKPQEKKLNKLRIHTTKYIKYEK